MANLPQSQTADLWRVLEWRQGRLAETRSNANPVEVANAPASSGLYQMTWDGDGAQDWAMLNKTRPVSASVRVPDRQLDFSDRERPVLLTLGRTTNIYKRIRQHFGNNRHNSRVLSRLGQILPGLSGDEIRLLAIRNLRIEWVVVASWVERCLLEKYGAAIGRPILDIDAEH